MLRAKAVHFKEQGTSLRNKILSSTDTVGSIAGIPVVAQTVNAVNNIKPVRKVMEATIGISADAKLPKFESKTFRKRFKGSTATEADAGEFTTGKVALFSTCYGNRNEPGMNEDLVAVLDHNNIPVVLAEKEQCCGMPKLELGDLEAVAAAKEANIPVLAKLVDEGYDLMAPIPSCALMFKQELPLMYPDDEDVKKVQQAFFDPFEYLMLRHKENKLKTDFPNKLGKISYHVACHQRVQNIGLKTRDALQLVPETEVVPIERCSGHDGTYAVKKEFNAISNKICRPVVNKVKQAEAQHYTSDCMMAGHHIEHNLNDGSQAKHPMTLLRQAYGI
jgi:Fe-S oxidoreductase